MTGLAVAAYRARIGKFGETFPRHPNHGEIAALNENAVLRERIKRLETERTNLSEIIAKYEQDISSRFLAANPRTGLPTLTLIIEKVCRHYGYSRREILSVRRDALVVRPRHVIMHLARKLTSLSFPEIGRRLGGRDHTSALHGDRRIASMRSSDKELDELLITLERRILDASSQQIESPGTTDANPTNDARQAG